jgi:hypothetical protein
MDAATLIERIDRELQEQEPLFTALHEALSGCDPELRFGVRTTELPDLPAPSAAGAPRSLLHAVALHRPL